MNRDLYFIEMNREFWQMCEQFFNEANGCVIASNIFSCSNVNCVKDIHKETKYEHLAGNFCYFNKYAENFFSFQLRASPLTSTESNFS